MSLLANLEANDMGKTYRKSHNVFMREPKGHKQALINNVRSKAVPPSAWDDKGTTDLTAYRAVERMVKRGWNASIIIEKLRGKFGFSHKEAAVLVDWSID
jgi:hypothetical protein